MPLYAVQNTEYEYYKYGTEPNATVVGSPTNENGVISGFTTANYLKFPQEFKPESKTWEMLWKVTTGSSFTASNWAAGIFGEPTNNNYGVWLDIDTSGHLRLFVGTGNGRQTVTSTATLAKATTYYIKAYYTGTQYLVDYSTDNVTFENIIIIDYATPMAFIPGNVQMIGQSHYGGVIGGSGYNGAWLGSIDLNGCHIKIDDKMWWNGTKAILSTKDDYDYKVPKVKNYTVQDIQYDYYSEWIQPLNPTGVTATSGWANVMNAFDGASSTYATVTNSTGYIEYDFGQDVLVTGVSINGTQINAQVTQTDFKIYKVENDVETLITETVGRAEGSYTTKATFSPINCTKIRLYSIHAGTYQARINEITIQTAPKKLTQEEYFKQDNKYIYYKYIYENWEQPVFTSATTWGTVSADNYASGSSQHPWQALDGETSGGDGADFASSSGKTVNWYWQFAKPLQLHNIKIWNRGNASNYGGATTYTIYGLQKDGNYIEIGTLSLSATAWVFDEIIISNSSPFYGLKIYCAGNKEYVGIGEILLTAKIVSSVEGTKDDYDYKVLQTPYYKVPKTKNYTVQNTMYEYYKYGTEPNATIMGAPTIEEGVASNFVGSGNYLVIPEPMDVSKGQSWEVGCKVVYKKSTSSYGIILGKNQNSGYQSFLGFRNSDLCTRIRLSNNNSSETIVVAGQTQLEEGKVYWIKYEFTGSAYNIYLSTNGIDYVLDGTSSNTTSYTQQLQNIGSAYDTGNNERHAFGGSLDLKETYIKINDKMWWNGTKGVLSTKDDYDYKVVKRQNNLMKG